MAKSYFSRTPSITNERQMFAKLAERTGKLTVPEEGGEGSPMRTLEPLPSAVSPAAPTLQWMPPERNTDGSGRQFDSSRTYRVTKTIKGDTVTYFAWNDHSRKLLGYHPTVEHCRDLCQKHWETVSGTGDV